MGRRRAGSGPDWPLGGGWGPLALDCKRHEPSQCFHNSRYWFPTPLMGGRGEGRLVGGVRGRDREERETKKICTSP